MIGKKKVFGIFLVLTLLGYKKGTPQGNNETVCLMAIRGPSPSRVFVTLFMLSRVVPMFLTQDHAELNRSSESLISAWQPPNKELPQRTYFKEEIFIGPVAVLCVLRRKNQSSTSSALSLGYLTLAFGSLLDGW